MKEGIAAHVAELKGHTDLSAKPKSVQLIRGDVYRAGGQTGENPILKHVDELKWQTSLKREPAPLQPIPKEQQAAERLGKPPPRGVSGRVAFFLSYFLSSRSQSGEFHSPTQQSDGSEGFSAQQSLSPTLREVNKRSEQMKPTFDPEALRSHKLKSFYTEYIFWKDYRQWKDSQPPKEQ
jgi:hypothetical protein